MNFLDVVPCTCMYAAFLLKHRHMKKLLGLLLYFGVRNQAK